MMNAVERQATFAMLTNMTSASKASTSTSSISSTSSTNSSNSSSGSSSSSASSTSSLSAGNVLMDITAAVNAQQQKQQKLQQQQHEPEPEQHQQPHMMECNTAAMDPTMMSDPRIIVNLLATERSTMPTCDYFRHVQREILPFMRKVVTTWMLEVCDEQRCEEQVFPLAINYMDRFLCLCPIAKNQFQLLGAVCLLMATKIRQCYALTADLLCAYTEYSVTPDEIRNWELLMLATLQWNVNGTTAFDFVDHILVRVPWGRENAHIRQHAHTLVSVCCTEMMFVCVPPSLLASACVCAATRGVNAPSARYALRDVCLLTQCDPIEVEYTVHHIENVVAAETAALQEQQFQLQQQQQQQQLMHAHPQEKMMCKPVQQQQQPQQLQQHSIMLPVLPQQQQFVSGTFVSAQTTKHVGDDDDAGQYDFGQPKLLDGEVCLDDSGVLDDKPDTPTDDDVSDVLF